MQGRILTENVPDLEDYTHDVWLYAYGMCAHDVWYVYMYKHD